jgi:prephenate dehydratase
LVATSKVVIQGERGAFSHTAAIQIFGPEVDVLPRRSFEELFEAVSDEDADYAVVPVENTLAGSVQRNLDLLVQHTLHATAETRVPVRLCLVVEPGRELAEIRSAASHPVALQQCHRFFAGHPRIEARVAYDTAGSVKDLLEGRADYDAAIGSALAAKLYGGEVLVEGLEDDPGNFTRFFAVAREVARAPEEGSKTSIAFTLAHRPGSLQHALACFADRNVDLTRLESRPIPGRPWEYRFYADLRGVPLSVQNACVEEMRGVAGEVRVLGQYPEEPAK